MGRQDIRRRWITAAAVALTLVAGCSKSEPTGPGKYDQTWRTGYSDTTCADWNTKMNDHQRWVAAADMLVNGRKTWGIDTMPADSLVDTFEGDVFQGCDPSIVADQSIVDTATSLLMIGGRAQYGG